MPAKITEEARWGRFWDRFVKAKRGLIADAGWEPDQREAV